MFLAGCHGELFGIEEDYVSVLMDHGITEQVFGSNTHVANEPGFIYPGTADHPAHNGSVVVIDVVVMAVVDVVVDVVAELQDDSNRYHYQDGEQYPENSSFHLNLLYY